MSDFCLVRCSGSVFYPCNNILCVSHGARVYLNYARAVNRLADRGFWFFNTVVNNLSWSARDHVADFFYQFSRSAEFSFWSDRVGLSFSVIGEFHSVANTIHLNIYSRLNPDYRSFVSPDQVFLFLNSLGARLKSFLIDRGVSFGRVSDSSAVTVRADFDCRSMGVLYAHKSALGSIADRRALLACNGGRLYLYQSKNFFAGSRDKASRDFKRDKRAFAEDLFYCFKGDLPVSKSNHGKFWLPRLMYFYYRDHGLGGLRRLFDPVILELLFDLSLRDTAFYRVFVDRVMSGSGYLVGYVNEFLDCVRLFRSLADRCSDSDKNYLRSLGSARDLDRAYKTFLRCGSVRANSLVFIIGSSFTDRFFSFPGLDHISGFVSRFFDSFDHSFAAFRPLRM